MYAIGVGPTNPGVQSGVGSSSNPLARGVGNFRVVFGFAGRFGGNSVEATPLFVGLTANFVGLYQINVTIPQDAPRGDNVAVALASDDGMSNRCDCDRVTRLSRRRERIRAPRPVTGRAPSS